MMDYMKIIKPALLLDEFKCRQNISTMSAKAKASGVIFRPHFKTHQSVTIGEWFREEGVSAITVSSVTMAKHFAKNGWKDITIAFPLNLREIEDVRNLSDNIRLNTLVSGFEQVQFVIRKVQFESGCFLKINTGLDRSGIEWDDKEMVIRIVDEINKSRHIRFKGFLTHSGHTYKTSTIKEIIDIYNDTLNKFLSLRSLYPSSDIILSTGDTPSCSLVNNFTGFDEIRPGNFVFYDLTQIQLGSCKSDQVAVALACPVVEKNQKRKEIIIYGGGVHLSKESLKLPDGRIVYGEAAIFNDNEWIFPSERSFVKSLSQEHGIISSSEELINNIKIGGLIGIIPVHSCMTADLMRQYYTFDKSIIADFSSK